MAKRTLALLQSERRDVVVLQDTGASRTYEPPTMSVLGTVHALTLQIPKAYGPSDGFTFNNIAITTVSP